MVGNDATVFHGDDAFLEMVDDGLVVGGDKEGSAEIVDFFQKVDDFFGGEVVKIGGRLVGDEDFGLAGDGAGDGDALFLATRKLGGEFFRLVEETDKFENFGNGTADFFVAHAGDFEGEGDVFIDGAARKEFEILEDYAKATAIVGDVAGFDIVEIDAADDNFAGILALFFGNHFGEGGLPCAGFTNDKDEFVGADMERNIVEGGDFVSRIGF